MRVTRLRSGKPGGVTLRQIAPPSRVSCTRLELVPTQISPACTDDGAMVSMTPCSVLCGASVSSLSA
jgi:hypothetical protein